MSTLILVYSFTGNNRLLAEVLASRIGGIVEEIRPLRRRRQISILLDMIFRRQPAIAPLVNDPGAFDHVLLLAPLWDKKIAHPMASAIRREASRFNRYSFASLCGYDRPGQHAHVVAELTGLVGRAPDHAIELHVAQLVAPADRERISRVTPRRVTPADMDRYAAQLDTIAGWFNA